MDTSGLKHHASPSTTETLNSISQKATGHLAIKTSILSPIGHVVGPGKVQRTDEHLKFPKRKPV